MNRRSMMVAGAPLALVVATSAAMANEVAVPFTSKLWQLRVVALTNPGTVNAVLTAQISSEGAREYCDRDPGGETIQYGGRLTKRQCVQQLLAKEGRKILTFRANCPQRLIFDGDRWYRQMPRNRAGEMHWQDGHSRRVLDSSGASNHGAHNEQLKMLCPGARTSDL